MRQARLHHDLHAVGREEEEWACPKMSEEGPVAAEWACHPKNAAALVVVLAAASRCRLLARRAPVPQQQVLALGQAQQQLVLVLVPLRQELPPELPGRQAVVEVTPGRSR